MSDLTPAARPRCRTRCRGRTVGMGTIVTRGELLRLVNEQSAQVVEVLPRREYDEEHLPDAISLPLKELNNTTAARLDRSRPVITYCHDSL
jgi:rhodanese-related sulfurtransferase